MSKYYAVRKGKVAGIYRSWDDCKKQITGVSGAVYKSFKTQKEAEDYIAYEIPKIDTTKKIVEIYTDGSHQPSKNYLGVGAWCKHEEKEYSMSKTCNAELLETYGITETTCSNPTAEFIGFAEVLKEFRNVSDAYELVFYLDYEGVENWMMGSWKAKESYIRKILAICGDIKKEMKCGIHFKHVKGHSGNEGNDKADELAKSSEYKNEFVDLVKLLV